MKQFLDCGAYSSWRKEKQIDLDAYIKFVQPRQHLLHAIFSLDTIAGFNGRRDRRSAVIEAAARQSYQNHLRMKAAGLHTIPTFHMDEDFDWLQRYLDDGERYIGLAPHKIHSSEGEMLVWLDECFDCIAKTRPLIRTHLLGVTSSLILARYPFASADSTTWFQQAYNGQIPIPLRDNGRWVYALRPTIISVTDLSRARTNHVDAKPHFELDRINDYLDQCGVTLAEVRDGRDSQHHRQLVWLKYFRAMEDYLSAPRTMFAHPSLQLRPADWKFDIAYVTDNSSQQYKALVEGKAQSCLLSYFALRTKRADTLERYVNGQLHQD